MFGRRLNDNAIQLLASARQEPIELRIARGVAGMFLGKTNTVDQGLIDALLSAERATVDAESKVPAVLTARLDLRILQLRQIGGPSGLTPLRQHKHLMRPGRPRWFESPVSYRHGPRQNFSPRAQEPRSLLSKFCQPVRTTSPCSMAWLTLFSVPACHPSALDCWRRRAANGCK